ncbi:TPA: isomerase [Burkholderia cenocepacia]|nr:isomerase [Burkholderia cenocepacia]
MNLSAHLGYQFTEVPFSERFALAARSGYRAVEFPSPYAFDASGLDDLLGQHRLQLVQFGTPMGAPENGDKGTAALKARRTEFEEGLERALEMAIRLRCPRIHVMAGIVRADADADWDVYVENVRRAVNMFAAHDIATLIEVMSPQEVPGYFMSSFEQAEALFDAIPDRNLQFLFDTYHAAVLTGDAAGSLQRWLHRTGHIQISDFPGRHEPGTGTLPFKDMFDLLSASQYTGWLGCEYRPQTTTIEGLVHLQAYLPPLNH